MSDSLDAFVARLAPSQRPAAADASLAAILAAAYEAGRQAWPGVELGAVEFAAHLGQCVGARPELAPQGVAQLSTAELYLAAACVHGRPSAIATFRAGFLAEIETPLRRAGLRGADADELAQAQAWLRKHGGARG